VQEQGGGCRRKQGGDRWVQTGGKKGARQLPLTQGCAYAVLRRYGSITRKNSDKPVFRFQFYKLLDAETNASEAGFPILWHVLPMPKPGQRLSRQPTKKRSGVAVMGGKKRRQTPTATKEKAALVPEGVAVTAVTAETAAPATLPWPPTTQQTSSSAPLPQRSPYEIPWSEFMASPCARPLRPF
jgi:hypothetical protein